MAGDWLQCLQELPAKEPALHAAQIIKGAKNLILITNSYGSYKKKSNW